MKSEKSVEQESVPVWKIFNQQFELSGQDEPAHSNIVGGAKVDREKDIKPERHPRIYVGVVAGTLAN